MSATAQDELDAWRGRIDSKRWVHVDSEYCGETQRGGVLVETCWLPCDAGAVLGPDFKRGKDGHWRTVIPTTEYCGVTLGLVLQKVALALTQRRDQGRRP